VYTGQSSFLFNAKPVSLSRLVFVHTGSSDQSGDPDDGPLDLWEALGTMRPGGSGDGQWAE
jgi:hypothetical protein